MLYILLLILLLIALISQSPVFGQLPSGKILIKIKTLPNFNGKSIHNQEFTSMKPENVTYADMIYRALIKEHPSKIPDKILPNRQPDWNKDAPSITWFGHSSYLFKVNGKSILVDPIISQRASPFQFLGTKAFNGTEFFTIEMLPKVDYVIITHDHYDHLDYNFVLKMKNSQVKYITSIGVGAHLQKWGISKDSIIELVWGESFVAEEGISITAETARHFSGRGLKRNLSLWSSFVIITNDGNYYLGGDSGYGDHFKTLGQKYGTFEIALLECGQYNEMWPKIHMFPEETVQAALDLGAKSLMPIHWGKFALSTHPWTEPVERVLLAGEKQNLNIRVPYLGETVVISEAYQNHKWWKE